ncbi:MAG: hypothetical protein AAB473_03325 [Patescibacteria group bacterium]
MDHIPVIDTFFSVVAYLAICTLPFGAGWILWRERAKMHAQGCVYGITQNEKASIVIAFLGAVLGCMGFIISQNSAELAKYCGFSFIGSTVMLIIGGFVSALYYRGRDEELRSRY